MSQPYIALNRADWAALADNTQINIDEDTLNKLRGLGDPTDQKDVTEVYRPLTQLLHLHISNTGRLFQQSNEFLRIKTKRTPFIIGIAGSVAVGKSTTARLLAELLRRSPGNPKVDLVTTDAFLYPNEELEKRGILNRKGFPESYDRKTLLQFVIDVKSGVQLVEAPIYSHLSYNIIPNKTIQISQPDILILEGLNVLQPPKQSWPRESLVVSDFFDFSVYVDADPRHIRRWFVERFMQLRNTAFRKPESFFRKYTSLSDDEAKGFAISIWDQINGPNLIENIAPTQERATAILKKGPNHELTSVLIRKI